MSLIRWAILDPTGAPVRLGTLPASASAADLPDADVVWVPEAMSREEVWASRCVNGVWVPRADLPPPEPEPTAAAVAARALEAGRREARAQVLEAAAHVQRLYLTDLPGQTLVYEHKRLQALAYLAASADAPAPEDAEVYPLLASELRAGRAGSYWQAAQVIAYRAGVWTGLAAALDAARYRADDALAAAQDEAAIAAALAAYAAALDALTATYPPG
ncbi:hypothetical protein [Rubellimicrobium aerolatum]|uniref:Uncharacterized protein n=1 Tax=Rubellimicrobium aerolatum TaxID=490979 RepID=A0ABW0SF29_9RHOB|nr:hypothetical protein [Rubellimicrobium aerolatum]MBP1806454.1 hypothetical protein [Rubellimicrobium aerolatum]